MKKKIFIVLIITLSLFSFNKNVLAKIEYDSKYGYECKDGYQLAKSDGKYVCCPDDFQLINKITQGVQYKVCYNSKKNKEKDYKKASIVAEKEKLTIKREGMSDVTKECIRKTSGTDKAYNCSIKLSEFTKANIAANGEKYYLGYCKNENCKNDKYNRSETIELHEDQTIYIYYTDLMAKCEYDGNLVISFGKKEMNGFINSTDVTSKLKFTAIMMRTFYESGMTCPPYLYKEARSSNTKFAGEISSSEYYLYSCTKGCNAPSCKCDIVGLKNKTDYLNTNDEKKVKSAKEGCAIIGEGTMKIINDILKIVRIIVPLLLIGLGILDFTKSVFSGKEDDMNKNRSKFIKRIVAGVLVFFVPMFVNLILNFANDAWSWMNPDTCIK